MGAHYLSFRSGITKISSPLQIMTHNILNKFKFESCIVIQPIPAKKIDKNRSDILDTAWKLFKSNGVPATTMKTIAEQSGLSVRAVFDHFPNKQLLLWGLLARENRLNLRAMALRLKEKTSDPVSYLMALIE